MTSEQAVSSAIADLGLEPSDQHVQRMRTAIAEGAYDVPGPSRALLDAEEEVSRTFQEWTQRQPGDREGESFFNMTGAVGNYADVRDQVAQARKMAEASHV